MLSETQAQNVVNAYKDKEFFAQFVEDKRCVEVLHRFIFHPYSSIMIFANKQPEANMILDAHRIALTALPIEFQPRIAANNRGSIAADYGGMHGSVIRTASNVNYLRGMNYNLVLLSNSIKRREYEEFMMAVAPTMHATNGRIVRWEH